MALSYATIDGTKLECTPMQVKFKFPGASSATDLGSTLSNVVIETKYEKTDLKADQLGTTVIDRRVKGLVITVTTEIAEVQDKQFWLAVFPHATLTTVLTQTVIDFNSAVGDSDLGNAGELTLHPLSKAATDVDYDYTFFKACASAESSITYGPDQQARLKIVWNVLPDTSATPAKFYRYGDVAV